MYSYKWFLLEIKIDSRLFNSTLVTWYSVSVNEMVYSIYRTTKRYYICIYCYNVLVHVTMNNISPFIGYVYLNTLGAALLLYCFILCYKIVNVNLVSFVQLKSMRNVVFYFAKHIAEEIVPSYNNYYVNLRHQL